MSFYDYWAYDTIDFFERFLSENINKNNVNKFLEWFGVEYYNCKYDSIGAKKLLLVYSSSDYTFSSRDLGWLLDGTSVSLYSFDDNNIVFVDLPSVRDSYYVNSAAFIKLFSRAFPGKNRFVIKINESIAFGSTRAADESFNNNFCVTRVFESCSMRDLLTFLDEVDFENHGNYVLSIVSFSPQEQYEYCPAPKREIENDGEQLNLWEDDDFQIFITYKEACKVLEHVASEHNVSSFDVLQEALLSEEKVSSVPIGFVSSDVEPLAFEDEDNYSADAYADAEQMLKEMLKK